MTTSTRMPVLSVPSMSLLLKMFRQSENFVVFAMIAYELGRSKISDLFLIKLSNNPKIKWQNLSAFMQCCVTTVYIT